MVEVPAPLTTLPLLSSLLLAAVGFVVVVVVVIVVTIVVVVVVVALVLMLVLVLMVAVVCERLEFGLLIGIAKLWPALAKRQESETWSLRWPQVFITR